VTRAFVAVRPPDTVLDTVAARFEGVALPPGGRRMPREQWHLTVQFLGNAVDLEAVSAGLQGLTMPAGRLQLSGAGTLPPERRSKYLVLFVREGLEWMRALASEVAARVAPLGHVPEAREYTPHLTLARFKARVDLREPCTTFGPEPVGDPWNVGEIVLFESRLHQSGAEHRPHATVPLSG
jgi:RNA 2',3'-cyclic 3'-phosphodiesterase